MTTIGTLGTSSYGTRTVEIEVTGVCQQDVAKTSTYTVKVPYSRMSQAMQSINRMGGKVAGVTVSTSGVTVSTSD
ncbi:MAG: phycobilisome linker polypeptide [Cyanobacteria bacterium P01_D01_bin.123]